MWKKRALCTVLFAQFLSSTSMVSASGSGGLPPDLDAAGNPSAPAATPRTAALAGPLDDAGQPVAGKPLYALFG